MTCPNVRKCRIADSSENMVSYRFVRFLLSNGKLQCTTDGNYVTPIVNSMTTGDSLCHAVHLERVIIVIVCLSFSRRRI